MKKSGSTVREDNSVFLFSQKVRKVADALIGTAAKPSHYGADESPGQRAY